VSTVPDQNDVNLVEQARRQINRLAEEIAHLSEQDLAPADYYGEFLQRVLQALAAPAGAVWLLTQQGNLQLQYQVNMREVGLDRSEDGRASHDELLRQAITRGQSGLLPPHSGLGPAEGNRPPAANPTDYLILLAPIMVDKQVAGLVEVWQDPRRGPDAQRGFLQFLIRMAALAAGYTRNHQLRQMVGQQQVWTQLEAFARQIHNSLNPTEVAYVVANEGRRLVECDRISVGLRLGQKTKVEAISGADVVEKRSNLVQLMRKLFDAVQGWGEKLTFTGVKDDSLPPAVLAALDDYLAESASKLLVVLPLRDERETQSKRPPRSALMLEAYEPPPAPDQMIARLEVIGKHATTALYNATEHKRIPFRFIWMPIARLQEGLGGKAKAITASIMLALTVLVVSMIVVPYPLKMEASGQVWPIKRANIYPPVSGTVIGFPALLRNGDRVTKGQELIHMYSPDLAEQMNNLIHGIDADKKQIQAIMAEQQRDPHGIDKTLKRIELTASMNSKIDMLKNMRLLYNADPMNPGFLWLRSPLDGVVLTPDFREKLTGASVKESQPLMRIGTYTPGAKKNDLKDWEVELKIPQKHVGQVLSAFSRIKPGEALDVDIMLRSDPTRMYKGKLTRNKVAAEATPNRDDNNEAEPVTMAWVRLYGNDIPAGYELPPEALIAGVEVRTRIRCGDRAMGYSLFYGVWEFLYEKVVFFF
jgi:hypothetical protein